MCGGGAERRPDLCDALRQPQQCRSIGCLLGEHCGDVGHTVALIRHRTQLRRRGRGVESVVAAQFSLQIRAEDPAGCVRVPGALHEPGASPHEVAAGERHGQGLDDHPGPARCPGEREHDEGEGELREGHPHARPHEVAQGLVALTEVVDRGGRFATDEHQHA